MRLKTQLHENIFHKAIAIHVVVVCSFVVLLSFSYIPHFYLQIFHECIILQVFNNFIQTLKSTLINFETVSKPFNGMYFYVLPHYACSVKHNKKLELHLTNACQVCNLFPKILWSFFFNI